MVRHVHAWDHAVTDARKFQGSGAIHCIHAHPIIESDQAVLFVPPVFCAPIDVFSGCSYYFEFTQQAVELCTNRRLQCGSREQLLFFFSPKCWQKLVRQVLDVLGQGIEDTNIFDLWATNGCLQKQENQNGTSGCLRLKSAAGRFILREFTPFQILL